MSLDLRTGKFFVKQEVPRDGADDVMANYFDSLALVNYFDTPQVEFVGRRIAQQVAILKEDINRRRTPFIDFVQNSGRRITVNKPKIRYHLRGRRNVNFRLTQTVVNPTPGLAHAPFTIEMNTNVWKPGDRLAPLTAPDQQVTVQDKGRTASGNWKYVVVYHTNNRDLFFPPEYLVQGTKWHKAGSSTYSEESADWGSSLFERGAAVLVFEVGLWKTGKELKLTDEVLNSGAIVATEIEYYEKNGHTKMRPVEDGKQLVTTVAEGQFMAETRWEQEQDLFWGVSAHDHIPDRTTGKYRHTGAGVMDFLRDGHTKRISPNPNLTSMSEITDFLDTIWDDMSPASSRVIFDTGRPGLKLADKLITREFGEKAAIRDIGDFLERSGEIIPGGVKAFKLLNPMFNAYELPTHGLVQFRWTPNFDAKWRGGEQHPRTGEYIMGYNYVGYDFGYGQGAQSNIVFVNRRNSEIWGYETGATAPYGPINDKNKGFYRMVHGGRYATLRHGEEYGLYVEDINKLVRILPNIR